MPATADFRLRPQGAWHYNHVTFTPIAKNFMLYCRLIYMLPILCVRLTIKVKVGIPESFKVGWYPPQKTGSSHLNPRTYTQIHIPPWYGGRGGEGLIGPLPKVFVMLQHFETILHSVEILWSSMGSGAAGGLWRHQQWSPSWPPS